MIRFNDKVRVQATLHSLPRADDDRYAGARGTVIWVAGCGDVAKVYWPTLGFSSFWATNQLRRAK